jgi:hypothetical protein
MFRFSKPPPTVKFWLSGFRHIMCRKCSSVLVYTAPEIFRLDEARGGYSLAIQVVVGGQESVRATTVKPIQWNMNK